MVLFSVCLTSYFGATAAEETSVHVAGFKSCGYYQRAKRVSQAISKAYPDVGPIHHEYDGRDQYHAFRAQQVKSLGPQGASHRTSPLVWVTKGSESIFIGGASDLIEYANTNFPLADFKV